MSSLGWRSFGLQPSRWTTDDVFLLIHPLKPLVILRSRISSAISNQFDERSWLLSVDIRSTATDDIDEFLDDLDGERNLHVKKNNNSITRPIINANFLLFVVVVSKTNLKIKPHLTMSNLH